MSLHDYVRPLPNHTAEGELQGNIKKQVIVPDIWHGGRIDKFLAHLLPNFSRSQLSTWLKSGHLKLNKNINQPKTKIVRGEVIEVSFNLCDLPDKPTYAYPTKTILLDVIYEDEHLLVINKPSGLIMHPGAGNSNDTLMNALFVHEPSLQELARAGIIHRLDKETTGLLVVAKNLISQTNLSRQMLNRTIERQYLALVQGEIISGGRIQTNYGRSPKNRLKMAVREQGREAITHYWVNTRYGYCTLLDVKLLTGRTHQIRVHMAYINHPIIGDPLYGKPLRSYKNMSSETSLILNQFKRQALHARRLSFMHPITNEALTFDAPLPFDFQNLLNYLS